MKVASADVGVPVTLMGGQIKKTSKRERGGACC